MKRLLLLLPLLSLVNCSTNQKNQIKKDQILATCSANNGTTLTISKKENRYIVSGIVDYMAGSSDTHEKKTIHYVIPKDSQFFYNSDPLHLRDSNNNECTAFGFEFINDSSGQLEKCAQAKSQLEWVGKYRANKAGKKTKKRDSKVAQISQNIKKYCSPFYGELIQITYWHSIKPNKYCTDGVELYEIKKPTVRSNLSPIKGIFTKSCQINHKMLNSIKEKNLVEL